MTTVLVVDDQLTTRHLISEILHSIGFMVVEAPSGEEAIWLAHKQQPDLILCDIEMPEPNGYDVLTALRQNPSTATIPFIFLTAKADKRDQRQGMELGADDYLTKPFTAEELIGALKARLAKQLTLKRKSSNILEQLHRGLTSTLPHELRTPLHGIMGLAQLLSMQPIAQNPHEVLEMSGQILKSAERLERMIENLLLYGQLTTSDPQHEYKNRLQTTQLLSVSDGVTGVAQQVAKRYKRLEDLRFDIQGLEVDCNAFALKKITEELVDNAFKFSQVNTTVQVATHGNDNMVVLEVTNEGRGMTETQISQIGAYQQFDRTVYEQQGLGLGLVIVRSLVEMNGGMFEIHSVPHQQTTVSVSLELQPQTDSPQRPDG
jgi:two-component system sensor histidine kinase/response regulator